MPRRAAPALCGAALGLALLAASWYAAFQVRALERADREILQGFAGLRRARVDPVASFIAHLCDPRPYVLLAALPIAVALVRRRLRSTLAIGAILLGANVTTELLKPLLTQPRPAAVLGGTGPAIASASWPSGHATASMALALCCVLAAPALLRPAIAALGAVFAVAVSYSFLTLGWHYPSDVFGGFLVAATWTLVGVGAVFAASPGASRRSTVIPHHLTVGEELGPAVVALLGALGLAALVALARPRAVAAYARGHETFLAGAAAIATLGLVLATGIMLALAGFDVRARPQLARLRASRGSGSG